MLLMFVKATLITVLKRGCIETLQEKEREKEMIDILNDLSPIFCKNCPYLKLIFNERLGSGKLAYSCVHLPKCIRAYNIGRDTDMKED